MHANGCAKTGAAAFKHRTETSAVKRHLAALIVSITATIFCNNRQLEQRPIAFLLQFAIEQIDELLLRPFAAPDLGENHAADQDLRGEDTIRVFSTTRASLFVKIRMLWSGGRVS